MMKHVVLLLASATLQRCLSFQGTSLPHTPSKVSMKAGRPSTVRLGSQRTKKPTTSSKTLLQSKQDQPTRSTALPFLEQPSTLDGSMVGDFGFDPLLLAGKDAFPRPGLPRRSQKEVMADYRDAELKHGRLAMLAAAAWPLQEVLSPLLANKWNLPNPLLETGGLSPSLVNGGLEQAGIPLAVAALFGGAAVLEGYGASLKKDQGEQWLPGDYGFDPAGIWKGLSMEKRKEMQLKELKNGRLAMIAVLGYVVQEAVTQTSALNALKALW